jgi:hypothetical protein
MIIRGMPMAQYHGEKGWASNSSINLFRDYGPKGYHDVKVSGIHPQKETEALLFGKAFDEFLIGTPESFAAQYWFKPEGMEFRSAKDKEFRDDLLNRNIGILKSEWSEVFKRMKDAILSHEGARDLMEGCETQVSIRNHFERWPNLGVQTRPDWLNLKGNNRTSGLPYIADLKTTLDYREWVDEFDVNNPYAGRAVWKNGYHRQAGLAQMLLAQEDEVRAVSPDGVTEQFLIVAEKAWPWRVGVFKLHPKTLDLGLGQVEHLLDLMNACHTADRWPNGVLDPVINLPEPTKTKEDEYARSVADPAL